MLLSDALVDEHEELRGTARRALADGASLAALGWTGLAIPERYGGAGMTHVELCVLFEELGRSLSPAPLLSTLAAATAILAGGDEAQRRAHLPRIAAGELVATLAWGATAEGDRLTGELRLVLDGDVADLLVVEAGGALYLVRGADAARARLPTMDDTRSLATVRLAGARGERLPDASALARALDVARVALAAEQLGGADRCLEMAVEHARTRVQFGRPIGSFQAVKHTLADMLVRVEGARSASRYAAWVADAAPAELPLATAIARTTCTQAYLANAGDCIQVHGGLGFTWEHPAHRYFKRARSAATLFPADHRAAVARYLELG